MKIFIDAGHNHSGFNTGAVGWGLKEQDITFIVAKRLSEILSARGVETKLSRPENGTNLGTDNSSAINARWQGANNWDADFFISIHCNAAASDAAVGAEILYQRIDSLAYAETILNTYVEKTGLRNRGVKYRADIAVIKHTKMPSVLIELAFISNQGEAAFLSGNTELIAEAIAQGIIKSFDIKTPEKVTEKPLVTRYNRVDEIPGWAVPTIQKLLKLGFLSGDGSGLDLSYDMIRLLVINDRAGLYD